MYYYKYMRTILDSWKSTIVEFKIQWWSFLQLHQKLLFLWSFIFCSYFCLALTVIVILRRFGELLSGILSPKAVFLRIHFFSARRRPFPCELRPAAMQPSLRLLLMPSFWTLCVWHGAARQSLLHRCPSAHPYALPLPAEQDWAVFTYLAKTEIAFQKFESNFFASIEMIHCSFSSRVLFLIFSSMNECVLFLWFHSNSSPSCFFNYDPHLDYSYNLTWMKTVNRY